MRLDDEQMEIIEKADKITGCYSSTIEETHWLNEEEAYSLIESFVENPLNDRINELNKKLNAQDKIINTQALEIARLKEDKKKVIDYVNGKIKKITDDNISELWLLNEEVGEFLYVLGDKE